jgi:hypothetical protein
MSFNAHAWTLIFFAVALSVAAVLWFNRRTN